MVSEDDDIWQSLRILFGTVPGQRVMQPRYGCALRRMVFENLNESTLTEIRELIRQAILFHEVRIDLLDIEVEVVDAPEGLLRLRLDYLIRSTNTRSNVVYPLYLQEGSHVEWPT